MPAPSLLLSLVVSSIRVTGLESCPAPEAVESHLDALVGQTASAGRFATLRRTPDGLQISLSERDGTVVSQRVVPGDRPCEDLAQITALVLASWLSDLTPQAVTAEPLPSLSLPVPAAPAARPNAWSWEVGFAPTGSFTGTALAPGGLIQLEAGPARTRWAVRFAGAYDGPRQGADGPGGVSWQRFQAGLGAGYELFRSPCRLELGGDVVLSDLLLQGVHFQPNSTATSLDPGLDVGARLSLLRGHWHPWAGVWATLWVRQEVPSVQGLALQTALPQVEVFAGLGVAWQSVERF